MKLVRNIAIAALLGTAAAVGYWAFVGFGSGGDPIKVTDPAKLAAGRDLYGKQCASCHGASLEGQPNWQQRLPNGRLPAPPHDASGHTWHHSDQQLFAITRDGLEQFAGEGYPTDMPKFKSVLTDEEIRSIIAFIKSTWPERERMARERMSEGAIQP
jgi:mono/diheme cytochrome c family protein